MALDENQIAQIVEKVVQKLGSSDGAAKRNVVIEEPARPSKPNPVARGEGRAQARAGTAGNLVDGPVGGGHGPGGGALEKGGLGKFRYAAPGIPSLISKGSK